MAIIVIIVLLILPFVMCGFLTWHGFLTKYSWIITLISLEVIILRVGNILVGDASLLDSCFPQARFNGYTVGEIHVTTRDLVPNGRRDDFQDSEMKTDFLLGVEKIAYPIEKKAYHDSQRKSAVKPIEIAKQTVIKVDKQRERGFISEGEKKEAMAELRISDQGLTDIQKKRNVSDTDKEKAETESEKLKTLLAEVKETVPSIDGALEGTTFSRKDKETIRKVLEAVYELYEKTDSRNQLIERVLQKLKRTNKN
jgi:molecular chaperone HtpG